MRYLGDKFFLMVMLWCYSMTINAQSLEKYAVGLDLSTRQAGQTTVFSNAEQAFLRTHGIGVSVMRSSANRWFWHSGLRVSWFRLAYDNIPDVRYAETGNIVRVGTRDQITTHTYLSLPLYLNYKLLNNKTINVYLRGGVLLDYLYQVKTKVNATYDGKWESVGSKGFNTDKFSKTVQLGAGLYVPIKPRFIMTLTPSYGYTFLNNREKEAQNRNYFDTISLDLSIVYQL